MKLNERHGQCSVAPGTNASGERRNTGEGEQGSMGETPGSNAVSPRGAMGKVKRHQKTHGPHKIGNDRADELAVAAKKEATRPLTPSSR